MGSIEDRAEPLTDRERVVSVLLGGAELASFAPGFSVAGHRSFSHSEPSYDFMVGPSLFEPGHHDVGAALAVTVW